MWMRTQALREQVAELADRGETAGWCSSRWRDSSEYVLKDAHKAHGENASALIELLGVDLLGPACADVQTE